jgi:hypothetical protein
VIDNDRLFNFDKFNDKLLFCYLFEDGLLNNEIQDDFNFYFNKMFYYLRVLF